MNEKSCLPFQAEIEEAAAANRNIRSAAQEHLSTCKPCAATFAEQSRLRELIAGLEPVTAPADFDFRLRARLANVKAGRASIIGWFRGSWAKPAWSVAAAAVIAVGGFTAFRTGLFEGGPSHGVISTANIWQSNDVLIDWSGRERSEQTAGPMAASIDRPRPVRSAVPRLSSEPGGVSTISVRPTNVVIPAGLQNPSDGAEIDVRRTDSAARISVDERGRRRSLSVPSYSLGSQEMIIPASTRALPPASERIW